MKAWFPRESIMAPLSKASPCPICRKPAGHRGDNLFHPFCSKRCKDIDLAGWLDGAYRISQPLDENDLEALEAELARRGLPDEAN